MNSIMKTVGALAHVGEKVNSASTYFDVVEIDGFAFDKASALLAYLQVQYVLEFDRLDDK